ncbi:hypothetical protein DFH09DRAFT_1079220 [Mycena vulgaris]|nr:hypothetical protein DFH09DRAFT_1079220 [Mycena vulgaris]
MRAREPRAKREHKREAREGTGSAREGRAKSRILGFWSSRAGIESRVLSRETGGAGEAQRAASNAARAAQPRMRSPAQLVPRAPPRRGRPRRSGLLPSAAHEGLGWEERARRISARLVSRSPGLHPASARQRRPVGYTRAARTSSRERMASRVAVLDPGAARPRVVGHLIPRRTPRCTRASSAGGDENEGGRDAPGGDFDTGIVFLGDFGSNLNRTELNAKFRFRFSKYLNLNQKFGSAFGEEQWRSNPEPEF